MKYILQVLTVFALLLSFNFVFAQQIDLATGHHRSITDDLGLNAGYSFSSVTFKETDRTSLNQLVSTLKTTEKFKGDGFHFGFIRKITNVLSIELAYSSFSGKRNRDENTSSFITNELTGFQIPLMANFLLREETRDLNFIIGGGLQYLNAKGEEIEETASTRKQLSAFSISTIYGSFNYGAQYRLAHNIYAAYTGRLSVSTGAKSADNGTFTVKYFLGVKMGKSKLTKSEEIERLLDKLEPEIQNLLNYLRSIILNVDPIMGEEVKWNSVSFYYKGEMTAFDPKTYQRDFLVCNTHQGKIRLVLPNGSNLRTPIKGKDYPDGRKIIPIRDLSELMSIKNTLQDLTKEWIARIEKE